MSSGERKRMEAKPFPWNTRQGLWGRGRGTDQPGLPAWRGVRKTRVSGRPLEGVAVEGESPVHENSMVLPVVFPSSTEPVKFGVNLAGPPAKPEYSLMTDSGQVP